MQRIGKIPRYIADTKAELQAGDILIFNWNTERAIASAPAMAVSMQAGLNEGGFNETVHAGIVVELEDPDTGELKKKLAHLRFNGVVIEDLKEFSTTTHVYRSRKHAKEFGEELSKLIQEDIDAEAARTKQKVKWSFFASLRSIIRRATTSLGLKNRNPGKQTVNYNLPEHVEGKRSICSKWVTDKLLTVCHRMTNKSDDFRDFAADYINFDTYAPPKTLQAAMRNPNYVDFIIPSTKGKLYEEMQAVIWREIERLTPASGLPQYTEEEKSAVWQLIGFLQQSSPSDIKRFNLKITPKEKAYLLVTVLCDFDLCLDDKNANGEGDDVFVNTMELLKKIKPILEINTGNHAKTPTSYTNVMKFARSQGILPEYLDKNFHDANGKKLAPLVEDHYGYTPAMAKLYAQFCKRGYSDQDAKFEANPNPSLGEWLALNPVRNAIAGATVLPFLFGTIPYGLSRVVKVKQRNAKLIQAEEDKLSIQNRITEGNLEVINDPCERLNDKSSLSNPDEQRLILRKRRRK